MYMYKDLSLELLHHFHRERDSFKSKYLRKTARVSPCMLLRNPNSFSEKNEHFYDHSRCTCGIKTDTIKLIVRLHEDVILNPFCCNGTGP